VDRIDHITLVLWVDGDNGHRTVTVDVSDPQADPEFLKAVQDKWHRWSEQLWADLRRTGSGPISLG
jgi:hypothetical protein